MISRLLALAVVVAGASSPVFGRSAASAQLPDGLDPTSGRIVLIEPKQPKGALKVKQSKHVDRINAFEGMLVRRGYLLILKPTARAVVICGDGKKHELAPGPQGCPCTRPCAPEICGIRYDGSTMGATRGPVTNKNSFPVVISPRKTMLLNLRPQIRWARGSRAKKGSAYNVTLYGEGQKVIWSRNVAHKTRLNFPEQEPSLEPGQTYKVVVSSNGFSSEQDPAPGLGFTTLTKDEARAIAAEAIESVKHALPSKQTRLLEANLYAARELYAEAIDLLEALYGEMKEPAIARMLGDLYAIIGLRRESEKRYRLALRLTNRRDFDERGRILMSLSRLYETVGMIDQAIARLEEALAAYRRLGYETIIAGLLIDERRLKQAARPTNQ